MIEETFMEKHGAKYPFIRAAGVNQLYGIRFFPSVYCISPDGSILTVPDDRMPSESFIEEQLKNVSLTPKTPEDSRYDALRSLWDKREYKKLDDYLQRMLQAENLDDDVRAVYDQHKQELDKRSARQAARVAEIGMGPDFAAAEDKLERMKKEWHGLPPAAAAAAELARWQKDDRIKKELSADKALAKLMAKADTTKSSQRRKLIEDLEKFEDKHKGTAAAERAKAARLQLMAKR